MPMVVARPEPVAAQVMAPGAMVRPTPQLQLAPRTHRDGVFGMAVGVGVLVGLVALVLALATGMTEPAEHGGGKRHVISMLLASR